MNIKSFCRLFLVCVLPLAIGACNKNNNDAPDVVANPAHLAFVNVIPEATSLNLYYNGTRQNGYRIAYSESSGYISVASGMQNASFKDTTYTELLKATPITLKHDSSYVMYVTGDYDRIAGTNTVTTILTTNAEKVVAGKPKLRFVNASPNSPAVDVYLNSLVLANKAYKSVSGYALADTGTIAVKVNIAGTPTTLLSKSIKLSSNSVYTLYAYGLVNQSGTKGFNLGLNN
jgi:predicted transcriptional regulator